MNKNQDPHLITKSLKMQIAVLLLAPQLLLDAQTLQVFYTFDPSQLAQSTPNPYLTIGPDSNFYGTTKNGGINGYGSVFQLTTNGILHTTASFGFDDQNIYSWLTVGNDGNFYGTTPVFTVAGYTGFFYGSVFRVTPGGTLTTLRTFDDSEGAAPSAGLTLGNDGNFYGVTAGDYPNAAIVFEITTNGDLTRLASINGVGEQSPGALGLTLGKHGSFYGVTHWGGSYNDGTVFQVTTNGILSRQQNLWVDSSGSGSRPKL